jgi:murein DD-endopeptidase MepM/ murein hydrolase activator NlpD
MNLVIVSKRVGPMRQVDLSQPRTLFTLAGGSLLLVAAIFLCGLLLGRFVGGPLQVRSMMDALAGQQAALEATRRQVNANVDALAKRVGTLNAQLIRLEALGRRVTDLANLDRGEFDFDQPPPVGGPDHEVEDLAGSVYAPELTAVLDNFEARLEDRAQQLMVLENLMSMQQLTERILPGGWPLIGGWISSHFGYRNDPFTGRTALHRGVDIAAKPGTRVLSVGPGTVAFAGYKQGYGFVVEVSHPNGMLTRYGHNSRNLVRPGQTVAKGQPIAVIGSTGRSTGLHVHFEVERDGKVVNPMRYLGSP